MRVLVTGATGPFGRAVCRRLIADGHDVTAMARNKPRKLVAGVEFEAGDVRDVRAVSNAVAGCDAVVHLAWVVAPLKTEAETKEINLGGTRNILEAMAATGCKRLVFSSSVLAYGAVPGHPPMLTENDERRPPPEHFYAAHKKSAEDMIDRSGVDAVVVRAGIIAGRDVDNTIFRFFSSPALPVPDPDRRQQFVHTDDVARFTADAVSHSQSGAVNITGAGSLTMREIAAAIGRPLIRVPERALQRAIGAAWKLGVSELAPGEIGGLLYMPIVDTTRLREEWGFSCAWSSRDALEDMARASHGVVTLGKKTFALPWRISPDSPNHIGHLRAVLLRRTYADEVDRVQRDIARLTTDVDEDGGEDHRDVARRQLLTDVAAHAALLARIGEQTHMPRQAVERAVQASQAAEEGFSR
jgi:nucleoside-diphosphate-sugar epimerase